MMCNHEKLYCNKCNPDAMLLVARAAESLVAENKALRAEIAGLRRLLGEAKRVVSGFINEGNHDES